MAQDMLHLQHKASQVLPYGLRDMTLLPLNFVSCWETKFDKTKIHDK